MADHVVVTRDLMDGSRFRSAAPGVAIVRSTDAGEDGSDRILDPPIVIASHSDLSSSAVRIL